MDPRCSDLISAKTGTVAVQSDWHVSGAPRRSAVYARLQLLIAMSTLLSGFSCVGAGNRSRPNHER